jgi:MFS family permease
MADKGMTFSEASKIAMIVSVGGIFGGPVIGCISQTIGRRRALVFSGIVICALIPWGILPTSRIILTIGGFLGTFL